MTAPRTTVVLPERRGPGPAATMLAYLVLALIVGGTLWAVTRSGSSAPSAPASSGPVLVVPTIVLVLPTFPPTATPTPTRTPVPTETPRPSERDVWGECSNQTQPGTVCYRPATVAPEPTYRPCAPDVVGICRVPGEKDELSAQQEVE